jgi:hypothetical protein
MRTIKSIGLIVAVLGLLTAIITLVAEGIKLYRELPTATPQIHVTGDSPVTTSNSENTQPIFILETPSGDNAQPTSTPLILGNIIFDENFDNNNNGWSTGKVENNYEVYLDGGEYHIIGEPNGKGMWFGVKQITNLGNFYLETKSRRLDDSQQSNDYGVHFRQSNLINYVFVINPDKQSYALLRADRLTDQYTDLIHWVYSPRISTGFESNTIGILCKGDTIAIYINGYRIDSIKDSSSISGAIGFVGGTGEHVAFDYLRIWDLK